MTAPIGAVDDDLRSLRQWLTTEDVLRGRVRLVQAPLVPGQMGGVADAVVVALGAGGAGTILAQALVTWLRHRTADVKATITTARGDRVELDAQRVSDPQKAIEAVLAILDDKL
jgi:hypothetical protein